MELAAIRVLAVRGIEAAVRAVDLRAVYVIVLKILIVVTADMEI